MLVHEGHYHRYHDRVTGVVGTGVGPMLLWTATTCPSIALLLTAIVRLGMLMLRDYPCGRLVQQLGLTALQAQETTFPST